MTRRAESRSSSCCSVAGSSKARVIPAAIWRWKSSSFFAVLVAIARFSPLFVFSGGISRCRVYALAGSDSAFENDLRPALAESGEEGDGGVEVDGHLPLREGAVEQA